MSAERERAEAMLGEAIDLTAVETSERRPWLPGLPRFLRPGVPAILFAPREAGKSLLAMVACEQVVAAGGRVAYIDFENGKTRMAERMSAILADRDDEARQAVAERFAYYGKTRLSGIGDRGLADEWGEALGGFDLVVIDSVARALAQLGLDENLTPDFARFMVGRVDPLSERQVATLLLDNTGNDEQGRPRGASGKLDLCEVAYKVTSDTIAPHVHGRIRLRRARTRDGDEALDLEVGVGGGTFTRIEVADPSLHDLDLLAAAVDVLTAGGHEGSESLLSGDAVLRALRERGIRGDDKALRAKLRDAAQDPETPLKYVNRRGYYVSESAPVDGSPEQDRGEGSPARTGSTSEASENGSTEPDSAPVESSPERTAPAPVGDGGTLGPPDPRLGLRQTGAADSLTAALDDGATANGKGLPSAYDRSGDAP